MELARGLHQRGHLVSIAIFYKRGALIADVERVGIPIIDLKKRGRWDILGFIMLARQRLRKQQPDVLYSFLGGANIVAAAMRIGMPQVKLIWSIRASNVDLSKYDWLHRVSYRFERLLSGAPDLIIANSYAGRRHAVANGFPAERIEVVTNGIDIDCFRPDDALRDAQRIEWGLADDEIAVGVLARLDPMKGHRDFLCAAARLAQLRSDLRFFIVGAGPDESDLKKLAAELCRARKLTFTGVAPNPVAAFNALDICCSPSRFGEGFSNSIAEAMACGVPCVVTNVGDSASIVGQTGAVVPPSDPHALGQAILGLAARLDDESKRKARRRIVDHHSLGAMIDRTVVAFEMAGASALVARSS